MLTSIFSRPLCAAPSTGARRGALACSRRRVVTTRRTSTSGSCARLDVEPVALAAWRCGAGSQRRPSGRPSVDGYAPWSTAWAKTVDAELGGCARPGNRRQRIEKAQNRLGDGRAARSNGRPLGRPFNPSQGLEILGNRLGSGCTAASAPRCAKRRGRRRPRAPGPTAVVSPFRGSSGFSERIALAQYGC